MKHIHTESALAEGCHHLSYFYFFLVRVKYSIHGKYKRSIVPSVSIFSPGEFLPYLRATFFFWNIDVIVFFSFDLQNPCLAPLGQPQLQVSFLHMLEEGIIT